MDNYSEQKVLAMLEAGEVNQAIALLYKHELPKIIRYVQKNSGNEDDAFDVFQEAVLVLHQEVTKGNLDLKVGGFLYTVSRNVWLNTLKKRSKELLSDEVRDTEPSKVEFLSDMMEVEKKRVLDKVFSMLSEKCQKILHLTVYQSISMEDVAERMGYATANTAKTANYQCKQQLMKVVKDNKEALDFLLR